MATPKSTRPLTKILDSPSSGSTKRKNTPLDLGDRRFMVQAIEVMRHSIPEPRDDGKASPKVGAVLVKADGTIQTAFRGELRHGDHAEFTLLERKNRESNLDGCTLYATLEPCAPKARRFPKLGCAERIVLARIKKVWIGIEDPDPTVDRKGIKYLQDCGIEVEMFDRDLQEQIRAENQDFIKQAEERAAAAAIEEKTPEVELSTLERPLSSARIDSFSSEALEAYRSIARIDDPTDSRAFNGRLLQLGLLSEASGVYSPTGFGMLLFGKEPRLTMQQAGLLATIRYPDDKEEIENFEGPQVLVPAQVLKWLRDKLPNPIDRSEARRRDVNGPLYELIREGVVNALVHRDYSIAGAKCQLIVTEDKIEIRSPGLPVAPITLDQMQSFNASMLSRNPVLHYVFARMEMAEERGLGLRSMESRAVKIGIPRPKYTWEAPYLILTLYRSLASAASAGAARTTESLSSEEQKGYEFLISRGSISRKEYSEYMGFDDRKAQRQLRRLVTLGLIRTVGAGPTTEYVVENT